MSLGSHARMVHIRALGIRTKASFLDGLLLQSTFISLNTNVYMSSSLVVSQPFNSGDSSRGGGQCCARITCHCPCEVAKKLLVGRTHRRNVAAPPPESPRTGM